MRHFTSTLFSLFLFLSFNSVRVNATDYALEFMPPQFLQSVALHLKSKDRDNLALVSWQFYEIERTADWKNRKFKFWDGTPEDVLRKALFYKMIPTVTFKGCANLTTLGDLKGKEFRALDLSFSRLSKEEIAQLPTTLTKLSLRGVKGKLPIGHLTGLQNLCLDDTTDLDLIKTLSSFTNLRTLRLCHTNADNNDLVALLPQLEELHLDKCLVLLPFASYTLCERLTILSLINTPILEKVIEQLPLTLKELDLSECPHIRLGNLFPRFERLHTLRLAKTPVSSKTLQLPPSLLDFSVRECPSIVDLDFCEELTKLRRLNIAGVSINSAHLASLPTSLLDLKAYNIFGLVDHSPLKRLKYLTQLFISDNPIVSLEDLPFTLEVLDLTGCTRVDELESLKHFTRLWWLDLSYMNKGVNINDLPSSISTLSVIGNPAVWCLFDVDLPPLDCLHIDYNIFTSNTLKSLPNLREAVLRINADETNFSFLQYLSQSLVKLRIFLDPSHLESFESDIVPQLPKSLVELEMWENEGGGEYEIICRKIPPDIAAQLPNLRSYKIRKLPPRLPMMDNLLYIDDGTEDDTDEGGSVSEGEEGDGV